jgi:small-conductance mechanosensitive channel
MQEYITQLLDKWGMPAWAWNITVVIGTVVLGMLLSYLLSLFARKKTDTAEKFMLFQSALRHLSMPISILIPTLIFDLFLPVMKLPPVVLQRLDHAAEIAVIVLTAWTLVGGIHVLQDFTNDRININTVDNLRQRRIITQLMYVRRVVVAIIVLITIGAVLLTFGSMRKIGTGLLTGVGIGGIIIGFAAQRSLGNLLAGFQIAFTQPIRIDDKVLVENEFGRIEEITLTYVVVRIWDDRRLILPINYFIEKPFQNWTRTTTEVTGSVHFYLDYSIPIEWMRTQFMDIIQDHPLWDKRVAALQITDFKPDVMEVRGIVSSTNPGESWDLRCFIREEMMKRIHEHYPDALPKARAEIHTPNSVKLETLAYSPPAQ